MKHNFVTGTMVLAAAMMTATAVHAQPPAFSPAAERATLKNKMVSFSLRNDGDATIGVKAGDEELTLQPGKTLPVKLAEGTQLVATNTTPSYASGSLIVVVSSMLSDNTLVLR